MTYEEDDQRAEAMIQLINTLHSKLRREILPGLCCAITILNFQAEHTGEESPVSITASLICLLVCDCGPAQNLFSPATFLFPGAYVYA